MYSVLQCIETWRVLFQNSLTIVDVPFSAIVLAVPCWKIMLLLMMCFSVDIFYIGVEESIWSCRPWTDKCLIFCFVSLVLSLFLFYNICCKEPCQSRNRTGNLLSFFWKKMSPDHIHDPMRFGIGLRITLDKTYSNSYEHMLLDI